VRRIFPGKFSGVFSKENAPFLKKIQKKSKIFTLGYRFTGLLFCY